MSAIFISHSSKDNAIAGEIKAKLMEQGHRSIFLDFDPEAGIPAGGDWEKELYAKLRGCQAVIILCSEHSMTSPWCFAEITQARSLGKYLFPVKIVACQISPLLRDVQVTDLTLDSTEGYQRLWSGLKQVGLDPMDRFNWDGTRPPYPGLLSFQEQDAAVYFGRDAATQGTMETLNRLQRLGGSRLVVVLGASGSGKSSLMRAGVVPRLKRDNDRWLALEPFRPLERPFDQLAMVLASAFASSGNARDWKSIREALHSAADTADGAIWLDMANDLRVAAGRREATVLLVVDQFEELLARDTDQSASFFLRCLKAALSQPSGPFLAVATLRSDFLGAFQTHEALQDLLYEPIHLPQMALADFAQVIEGPGKVAGVEFDAGLVQAMVADTATDDALPLLAFALRELWDRCGDDGRLTLEEYRDRLGGLQGSLARAAEVLFAERRLSADEELHLRKAFLSMVRIDEEGRYARKPARLMELPENVHGLLERFVQARLLVARSEGAERILEVAHEALFRSWDRLLAWLNADREFLLWRQRLGGNRAEWERNEHDESTLLRGPVLAEAEHWLGERLDDLDAADRELIEASVALRKREQRAREKLRQRAVSGLVIGLSLALALAGIAAMQWMNAKEQAASALSRQLAAQAFNNLSRNIPLALLLGVEATQIAPTSEAWESLHAVLQSNASPGAFLRGDHEVSSVAISPNGRILASGHMDGTLDLWDIATHQRITRNSLKGHKLGERVSSLAFSPDGKVLASASWDATVRLWDVGTEKPIGVPLSGHANAVTGLAFSSDGTMLLSGSWDYKILIWDVATQRLLGDLLTHQIASAGLALSPDGKMLAIASQDGTVVLWDMVARSELTKPLSGHRQSTSCIAFSPDGKAIASGSEDGAVILWDAAGHKAIGDPLVNHKGPVTSVAFSPDSKTLASSSNDGTVVLWNVASGRPRAAPFATHRGPVTAVAFSPDGRTLASGGEDSTVLLSDTTGRQPLGVRLLGQQERVTSVAFSPNGKTLVTGDRNSLVLWDVADHKPVHEPLPIDGVFVSSQIAFAPDGMKLAATGGGYASLWDLSGPEPREDRLPIRGIGVAFHPDGSVIAFGDYDKLWLCNASTGHLCGEPLRSVQHWIHSVAFSPDGKTIAAAGEEKGIVLWDVATRRRLAEALSDHDGLLHSLAFSPDGKILAAGSSNRTVTLLDAASGRPLGDLLTGHLGTVNSVAFSPDGKLLASGSGDDTVILWDVANRRALGAPMSGHQSSVNDIAFSPDGKSLASGSEDGTVFIWDLDIESWRQHACRIANRNLTQREWHQFLGTRSYHKTCPGLLTPDE